LIPEVLQNFDQQPQSRKVRFSWYSILQWII